MKRAAFLDRDGTLNVQPPPHQYVTDVRDLELIPGAIEGAAQLAAAGYLLAVVSNQRGLARGLLDEAVLGSIEGVIQEELAAHGARIEAFRYCPHDLDTGCDCRKPRPGMLLELAEELGVDLGSSWMIGDSGTDVEAGALVCCRTALIGDDAGDLRPDVTAPSLATVAPLVLARS